MAFITLLAGIIFRFVNSSKRISSKFDIMSLQYALSRGLSFGLCISISHNPSLLTTQAEPNKYSQQRLILRAKNLLHVIKHNSHYYLNNFIRQNLTKRKNKLFTGQRLNCIEKRVFFFFFSTAQQPPEGHGLLIIADSRSHSVKHTVLGRTPLEETSTWQHTTLTREEHWCPQWDSNPQFLQVSSTDPRFRLLSH
jgi:hypothetical protein